MSAFGGKATAFTARFNRPGRIAWGAGTGRAEVHAELRIYNRLSQRGEKSLPQPVWKSAKIGRGHIVDRRAGQFWPAGGASSRLRLQRPAADPGTRSARPES